MSYDTVKKTDVDIVSEIITRTGDNRCPVGDNIEANTPIQGAMDNFSHRERTPDGVEEEDNTVLVIFQRS